MMKDKFTQFPRKSLNIKGEMGRRIELTIQKNLLKLAHEEDFLKFFRIQDSSAPGGYVGLGKLIDATVRFASWEHDEEVVALKKKIIDTLLENQNEEGYIGSFVVDERGWKLWDFHEMVYIVVGLTSDYHFFAEQRSLDAAKALMEYILACVTPELLESFKEQGITFENATIGFENAMMGLYRETGEERYIERLIELTKFDTWNWPIFMNVKGHAYTYMSRCLQQIELFRIKKDPALLEQSYKILDFALNKNGMVITGGLSHGERWHDNQYGQHLLAETCATVYYLWMLDQMIRLEGNSLYGDVMERVIYNTLFAAQSPDGRKLRYYTPFEGERHYFRKDTYCCPNNFRRLLSDLGEFVYYQSEEGVVVNLYNESELEYETKEGVRVKLSQETRYPSDGNILIRVDPEQQCEFELKLRIPRWTKSASILVNEASIDGDLQSGSFFSLNKVWKAGDVVELEFPMECRAIRGREMQSRHVAFMRGPILFGVNTTRQFIYLEPDLPSLRVSASSIRVLAEDVSVRPDGLALTSKGWSKKSNVIGPPDIRIEFSEFIDPGVRKVYFMTEDFLDEYIEEDELYKSWKPALREPMELIHADQ